jgi:hypothetical protein
MKPGIAAQQQPNKLRYWVVGVGFVVIAVFGLWPQSPIRPRGALAQELESELRLLSGQLGTQVTAAGCTTSGNLNLGVGCRVTPYSLKASKAMLLAHGWKQVESPPLLSASEHAAFVKANRYLTLDANSSQQLWALSIQARRE